MSFRAMLAMASGSAPPSQPPAAPGPVQKPAAKAVVKPGSKAEAPRPVGTASPKTTSSSINKSPVPISKGTLPITRKPLSKPSSGVSKAPPKAPPTPKEALKVASKPLSKPAAKPVAKPTSQPKTIAKPRGFEAPKVAEVPKKKISFKEAMKQAANVDKEKLKVTVKTREKDAQAAKKKSSPSVGSPRASPIPGSPRPIGQSVKPVRRPSHSSRPVQAAGGRPQPAPIARPSAKLAAKLKHRRRDEEDESDSEMDDFIDDEEEDGMNNAAIQDEIWSIFNKRPRQAYADESDSDDDMEATGADVFEEEMRSARVARREDEAEEARLAALAKRKAAKKLRR